MLLVLDTIGKIAFKTLIEVWCHQSDPLPINATLGKESRVHLFYSPGFHGNCTSHVLLMKPVIT